MRGYRRSRAVASGLIAVAIIVGACDASDDDAAEQTAYAEEPPLFVIDRNATGPLTMDELQIHIPANLREQLSDRKQACWLREIESMIAQAGDPATLDPVSIAYLRDTDAEAWSNLQPHMQRALLAQAITSEAINHC